MQTLREKLYQTSRFLFGVELVSIRGSMSETKAVKARTFANQLVDYPAIDWISVTDNAGGNPQLAPQALAKPILYAGKEVVIHLTCKDLNRNGLESEAWQLSSEGYHNVLAMTGDYPMSGNEGMAKPVFDIDSVGLISLLKKMNDGFGGRYEKTRFFIGAVTTNYKLLEGEVVPQYLKLQKKVECGAQFIINQVGFDSRKAHELRLYMDHREMKQIPLIGNVYLLNPRVAQIFHDGKIPGIVVTPVLLELCRKQGQSADGGNAFFQEFTAKQIAIFRGLGFRGAYLGGVHELAAIEGIMEIERTFSPDDWKQFAREIRFSRPGEFFYYAQNSTTGLADSTKQNTDSKARLRVPLYGIPKSWTVTPHFGVQARRNHVSPAFYVSKWAHDIMFTRGKALSNMGAKVCERSKDPSQGPAALRAVEKISKAILFRCKDCGDCSLPDIAYLCPESQCAKNQRNGPCGGTREGRCEVNGYGQCIWLRAYKRLKHEGEEEMLLQHVPVIQNQGLRGTSSWANNWLGRDHSAKKNPGLSIE
jgi:methylenetetrahydrofolate reductase (NADPH)